MRRHYDSQYAGQHLIMHIFSGSQTQSSKGRGTLLLEWISLKEMESGKNGNETSKKWNLAKMEMITQRNGIWQKWK